MFTKGKLLPSYIVNNMRWGDWSVIQSVRVVHGSHLPVNRIKCVGACGRCIMGLTGVIATVAMEGTAPVSNFSCCRDCGSEGQSAGGSSV